MILLYHGTGWLSKMIQKFTWGFFNHAAYKNNQTGEVIEAWYSVVKAKDEWVNHNDGTQIDYYDFEVPLTEDEENQIWMLLNAQLGKPYDYAGIVNFITRPDSGTSADQSKWFCSELVFFCVNRVRLMLNNIPAFKVYPTMLSFPTSLKFIKTEYKKQGVKKT